MNAIVHPPLHNSYDVSARRWITEGRCISCGSNDVPFARDRWGNILPRRIRRCRRHQELFARYKRLSKGLA